MDKSEIVELIFFNRDMIERKTTITVPTKKDVEKYLLTIKIPLDNTETLLEVNDFLGNDTLLKYNYVPSESIEYNFTNRINDTLFFQRRN